MPENRPRGLNRLSREKSPYLRQHADNPVDWFPWGDEAFMKAAAQDRPIFLSIGYSACHWCHVMERESFSDPEVARLLNQAFVCIKVDREERPDIDHIYMAACQHMTGQGGWPLTVIMTPGRKPFFAGTYFPRTGSGGRMGMMELIPKVQDLWQRRKERAVAAADEVFDSLARALHRPPGPTPSRGIADRAFAELLGQFDEEHGGFGSAPKFPMPVHLLFLLRHWHRTRDPAARKVVEKTLSAMRRGGVYDHVGFGFFRYSTDRRWLLPHFEKMLYDQALLAMVYTEAYQALGIEEYALASKEIISYVLRDLTSPEGAFYSSEDADSEGVEGLFYTWTPQDLDGALDSLESHVVQTVFNVRQEGNFSPERGENTSRNILFRSLDMEHLSSRLGLPEEDLEKILEAAKIKLLAARRQRPRPSRDQKILTDWNGLMVAALAKAAAAFEDVRLAEAADNAARFILDRLRNGSGRLMHRMCEGEVAVEANLDDYAFLAWGLIELYQCTYRESYFTGALGLLEEMLKLFWDKEDGGLFFTARGEGPIPLRLKPSSDGATPSGNAVAAAVLLKVARLTADPRYEEKVAAIGRAFSNQLSTSPSAYPLLAATLNMALGSSAQVVVVGDPSEKDTLRMLGAIRRSYWPHAVSAFIPTTGKAGASGILVPFARDLKAYDGKATAYVCKDFLCRSPTTDPGDMIRSLEDIEDPSRNKKR